MKPRRTLRIARWETTRSIGSLDRRTAVALLVVLLAIAAIMPGLIAANPTPGEGLYRVGVDEGSPYYDVVIAEPELRATADNPATARHDAPDVVIDGTEVYVTDSAKGRAAAGTVRQSIVKYNDRMMAAEPDQAAAFPVDVTLRYLPQVAPETRSGGDTGVERDGDAASATERANGEGIGGGGGGTESDGTGSDGQRSEGGGSEGPISGAPLGSYLGTTQSGTPAAISPPFPLRSLLLAFLFLLPFNVVIQAYGSSVIAERINRRGEPLLVTPASRGDIVIGKALPYFLGSVAITAAVAVGIGGGLVSVAAVTPLAALFLAATFLAGMLARSYKELTFLTVTISVSLTAYAFIPAVFAEVHPIATISPLTLVVEELQGVPIGVAEFVFATLPVTLAAGVLFALGLGMYREENMFTQRPLPQKVLDALAAPLVSSWRVGLWTALFIPFVLVLELFAVATLYVLPVGLSIPLLLVAVAVIEEVAKSIHVYAAFERARFDSTLRAAVILGAFSGAGFFLAEKLLAITQLVGLPDLEVGRVAFAPEVLGIDPALLLFAPLLLHVVTAVTSAAGARRSSTAYALALSVAVVVHVAYNLAVVSTLA